MVASLVGEELDRGAGRTSGVATWAVLACIIGGVTLGMAIFGLMIWAYSSSPFCPAGTLRSGIMFGAAALLGILGTLAGSVILGFSGALQVVYSHSSGALGSRTSVLVARWFAGSILGLALLAWAIGMPSYYCVSADSITLHPWPLSRTTLYPWSDVTRVEAYCERSWSGKHVYFHLHLKNGKHVTVARWDEELAQIARIAVRLPGTYKARRASGCPETFQELLIHGPGA